jgi:nicotinamidase-related amidase
MANVPIVDRSSLVSGLYKELKLDRGETAVITIDMHRGHLDMDVATMPAKPEDAKRVIANAAAALEVARKLNIPVIHVVLVYRKIPGMGSEGMVSPFWKAMHAQGEHDRLTPGR